MEVRFLLIPLFINTKNKTMKQLTFKKLLQDVKDGKVKLPNVSYGDKQIDAIKYQLAIDKYHLSLMSFGIKVKGKTLKQYKDFYEIGGKSAEQVMQNFLVIFYQYTMNN